MCLNAMAMNLFFQGSSDGPTDWYGVGFVISPRLRHHCRGFCQINDRIASLKLKCRGGTIAIITVLAPHNLRPQQEKWDFYEKLNQVASNTSTNGPKYFFGDFNARIGPSRPGEHGIVGPHSFGLEARHQVEMPNRDFLLEFCATHGLEIANTFCDVPVDKKVTYHEPGVPPLAPITYYLQLFCHAGFTTCFPRRCQRRFPCFQRPARNPCFKSLPSYRQTPDGIPKPQSYPLQEFS